MEIENEIYENALEIIAHSAFVKLSDLKEALENPTYNIFTKKKRSGGKRIIHEPLGKTFEVQNSLYYNFFVKVYAHDLIDQRCTGGVKGKSTKDNVMAHSFLAPKFIAEVDIKDAFHCVTTDALKAALYDLFQIEVYYYRFAYYMFLMSKKSVDFKLVSGYDSNSLSFERYELYLWYEEEGRRTWVTKNSEYGFAVKDLFRTNDLGYVDDFAEFSKNRSPLFPNKRNRLFRESIRDPLQFEYVSDLCECMADIVSKIVTYKGILVQGPPTSPFLMALMVSYTKLLSSFDFEGPRKYYRIGCKPRSFPDCYTREAIYVDNIGLSIDSNQNKERVRQNVEGQLRPIEQNTIWKFNHRKTKVYDLSKEEAVLTGLRLVRHRKTRQELKLMVKEKIKGARHCLRTWKPWYYLKPTIPKKTQRKIRACLHKACLATENSNEKLQRQARGYIGYIFHIYESYAEIPLQIRSKLDEYSDKKYKFLFVKFFHKKKNENKFKK